MPQNVGVLYLRVSSDEQSDADRSGLPVQRAACLALAEADGIPIAAEFEDSVSGRTLDRPALADLLARLPEFTHVFALDATRLGRRRAVSQTIRDAFREAGVALRLVHGGSSGIDAEGGVILDSVGDALSEIEIMRLTRRVQGGREARAKRGLPAGKLPVGWQTVRDARGRSIGAEFDESCRAFYDDLERLVLSGVSWNAIVREIHVFGSEVPIGGQDELAAQHKGLGALLLKEAEKIARDEFQSAKIAVISGVGARDYFRTECGYQLEGPYMVKNL